MFSSSSWPGNEALPFMCDITMDVYKPFFVSPTRAQESGKPPIWLALDEIHVIILAQTTPQPHSQATVPPPTWPGNEANYMFHFSSP